MPRPRRPARTRQNHGKATAPSPARMTPAPSVTPGGSIDDFTLSSLRGKYVVLFFWPLDFTFVCPTEII
ncbi:MAG TPA: redoxin domain-containing protein, partial [Candidatus Hydrogenedentes bacterium]|nr:redoxin domain-containing protein [Candidatus Hydrogenedentota bacterium]